MPNANVYEGSTPQEKDNIELVTAHVQAFEDTLQVELKERWDTLYRQYRGFRKTKYAWEKAGPNDRDEIVRDAVRDWGSRIHIPYAFATVETMLPIALAQRPGMQVVARDDRWEENVRHMKRTLEAQQHQVDVELKWEDTARAGFIYGIGWGKSLWGKRYAERRRVKRRVFLRHLPGQAEYVAGRLEQVCVFDDPLYEDVDPYDMMWNPLATSMDNCGWVVHRSWLSTEQVLAMLRSGAWNTETAQRLTEDDVRGLDNGQKYDEVQAERLSAQGLSVTHDRGEQPHEVWEWHNGRQVITVLDRQVNVIDGENPCVGTIPFHAYRPTPSRTQMVGIGLIEPIEGLCRELDMLRSQRRDAATLALCSGYAFDTAALDEDDLVFGPAAAIGVDNARPQDALFPLPKNEVPGSSYREEQSILSDLQLVTGMNDALAGGQMGTAQTATEAQLIQVGVSRRIGRQSRRFEVEVIRNNLRCWVHLNQRMVMGDKTYHVPEAQEAEEPGGPAEKVYTTWRVNPTQLMGEFDVLLDGGAQATNEQQERQDAQTIMQLLGGNPHINQRVLLQYALRKMGFDPEVWFTEQQAPLSPQTLKILEDAGVNPELINYAVETAQRQDPMLPDPPGPMPDQAQDPAPPVAGAM